MRNGSTFVGSFVESSEVIGGGGLCTGIMGSSDGTLIGRFDTTVAHTLGPSATSWQREMVPGTTIAAADVDTIYGINVYAAAIAWSDSTIRAIATMGYVFIKKSGASTYTKTALPRRSTMNPNSGTYRMCGSPLEFDPANPAVLLAGMPEGLFRSIDSGDTWTTISTASLPVPTPAGARYIIRFDRSSTVTAGKTTRVYCFVMGVGLYVSNDNGATWSAVSGSPTAKSHMKVRASDGLVMLCGGASDGIDGQISMWNRTSWTLGTRISGGAAANYFAIEFSTQHANRVYGVQGGGAYGVSLDSGATWSETVSPYQTSSTVDVAWHATDGTGGVNYRTATEIIEHPTLDRLRMSAGIGCWEFRVPPTTTDGVTPTLVYGLSRGIENMVGTCAIIAPDGNRCLTMQDKQSMCLTEAQAGQSFPTTHGPSLSIGFGTDADYAPEDTNFWVVSYYVDGTTNGLAFTTDFGQTWTTRTTLRTLTSGSGRGAVCVLSKDVWLAGQSIAGYPLSSSNRAKNALYVTRDRGLTWTEVVIGNGNATFIADSIYNARKVLAKDPYTTGTAYFYNMADAANPSSTDSLACVGVYKLVDNGTTITVTRQRTTRLWGFAREAFNFKFVHGGAAGVLLTGAGDDALGAFRSTDGGATWTELTGTDDQGIGTRFGEVYGISAGKKRFDSSYPTIYVAGFRIGVSDFYDDGATYGGLGLWASYDNGSTWARVEQFPGGIMLPPNDICASMNRFGDVTLTFPGLGAISRRYSYSMRLS